MFGLNLFWYALLCVLSCGNHLDEKERAGFFAMIVFLVSCYLTICSVALPHGLQCVIVVFLDHTYFLLASTTFCYLLRFFANCLDSEQD